MSNRVKFATIFALLTAFFAAGTAQAAPDRPATPPPTDFWQGKGFMNMAHQGGERQNPGNTLYAFKKAVRHDGADVIDLDATLTKDGVLVATHDEQPCHTSNAPCTAFRDLTLDQLREYDFAYWFTPWFGTYYDHSDAGKPHPYRGIATGDAPAPKGFTAADFRIATFDQVLKAFPGTPINVELKPYAGVEATAQAAADVLAANPGREEDVIINAFSQDMIERFHELAPNHLALGGSLSGTLAYVQGEPITPTPVAVQPPDKFNLPPVVDTLPILRPMFEYDGFISVVWPSDLDPTQETDAWYEKLIGQGANAINTMYPGKLHQYLCEAGIRRPDGSQRCGLQPPDAVPCPEGTQGEAPTCVPIPEPKVAKLKLHSVRLVSPRKRGAGRQAAIRVLLQNTGTGELRRVKVCAKVPKRKRRMIKTPRCRKFSSIKPGSVREFTIRARSTRKARGKVRIRVKVTSANGGKAVKTVNPIYRPAGHEGHNPLYEG